MKPQHVADLEHIAWAQRGGFAGPFLGEQHAFCAASTEHADGVLVESSSHQTVALGMYADLDVLSRYDHELLEPNVDPSDGLCAEWVSKASRSAERVSYCGSLRGWDRDSCGAPGTGPG